MEVLQKCTMLAGTQSWLIVLAGQVDDAIKIDVAYQSGGWVGAAMIESADALPIGRGLEFMSEDHCA